MRSNGKATDQSQFLSGWKEIANYLDKGVRTVQRYEREHGLPVRRPAAKSTGSVLATKAELDAWVTASPIREVFRLSRQAPNQTSGINVSNKDGVAEMVRLREQMTGLRNEVRTSVQVLRDSLHVLQGDLNNNRFRERPRSLTLLEPNERKGYILEMLDMALRHKAS